MEDLEKEEEENTSQERQEQEPENFKRRRRTSPAPTEARNSPKILPGKKTSPKATLNRSRRSSKGLQIEGDNPGDPPLDKKPTTFAELLMKTAREKAKVKEENIGRTPVRVRVRRIEAGMKSKTPEIKKKR